MKIESTERFARAVVPESAVKSERTEMAERITRQRARELGLPRYRTGKRCRNGHLDDRRVSDYNCCECHRIANRAFDHSPLGRETQWRKNRSPLGRERIVRYSKSPKGREARWRSRKRPLG